MEPVLGRHQVPGRLNLRSCKKGYEGSRHPGLENAKLIATEQIAVLPLTPRLWGSALLLQLSLVRICIMELLKRMSYCWAFSFQALQMRGAAPLRPQEALSLL